MPTIPTGRRTRVALGAVVVVLLVAAFAWFRPDALVVDRTVDDDVDPALAAALAATSTPTPTAVPRTGDSPSASPTTSPAVAATTPAPSPTTSPAPAAPSPAAPSPTATTASPTTAPATPTATPAGPTAAPDPTTAPDPPAPAPGPVVLARGEWTSLEHETTGTVALVDDDGDLRLALSDLATSNGPDLRVILSPKAGVAGDWYGYADGATELGALRGNRGTQVYDVPDDLDVADVASAVIWCERFAVGFGVANLT